MDTTNVEETGTAVQGPTSTDQQVLYTPTAPNEPGSVSSASADEGEETD